MLGIPTSNTLKKIILLATGLLSCTPAIAQTRDLPPGALKFENEHLLMVTMARTPDQLVAFYSARGFNQASIDALTERCFVFGMVDNKTEGTLWLILDDWQFIDETGQVIERMTRDDWKKTWQKTGLEQPQQSTFGWTQLPESRDLHQHEHVGGQLALPWQEQPFKLVAIFRTAADKKGTPQKVVFENLTCKKE